MNDRLYRSRDDRVFAGVAGGIADYLAIDPSLVRVVWVILALFSGGAFLIVYIVMAFVVPEEPWPGTWTAGMPYAAPPAPPASAPSGEPHDASGATDAPPADAAAGAARSSAFSTLAA